MDNMIHITQTEWYEKMIDSYARKMLEARDKGEDIFWMAGRGSCKTYTRLRIIERMREIENEGIKI